MEPFDLCVMDYLILHYIDTNPLHVVLGIDAEYELCIVITTYVPSRDIWNPDFKTRK